MICEVALFNDIGLDAEHRFVRDFASQQEQLAWFLSQSPVVYSDINYDKLNREFKLEMDFFTAKTYSYVQLAYEVEDTSNYNYIYAFVRSVRVVNDRTVAFSLEEDEWMMNAGVRGSVSIYKAFVERRLCDRRITDVYPETPTTGYRDPDDSEDHPICYWSGNCVDYASNPGTLTVEWVVVCYTDSGEKQLKYLAFPTCKWARDDGSVVHPSVDLMRCTDDPGADDDFWMNLYSFSKYHAGDMHISTATIQYINIVPWIGSEMPDFAVDSDGDRLYDRFKVDTGGNWTTESLDKVVDGVTHHYHYLEYIDYPEYKRLTNVGVFAPVMTSHLETDPLYLRAPFIRREVYSPNGTFVARTPDSFDALTTKMVLNNTGVPEADSLWAMPSGINGRWGVLMIPMPSASGFTVFGVFASYTYIQSDPTPEEVMSYAVRSGCLFEMPGVPVDVISDPWLEYTLTQRDTDRKLISANAVSGTASSVATGLIVGNVTGAAAGGVSGLIGGAVSQYAQDLKEEGIRNQPSRVTTVGTGNSLLVLGAMHYHLVVGVLNENERAYLKARFRWEGYSISRMMRGVDLRERIKYDYIKTSGCTVHGDMNEDSRKALESIFDRGVTIVHGTASVDFLLSGANNEV